MLETSRNVGILLRSRNAWLYVPAFCMLVAAWMTATAPLLEALPFLSQAPSLQAAIKAAGLVLITAAAILAITRSNRHATAPTSIHAPMQILLSLLIGIGAAGYVVFDGMRQSVRIEAHNNLASIGKLKTEQVNSWLAERYGDAIPHAQNMIFAKALLENLRQGAPSEQTLQLVVSKFKTYIATKHYQSAGLFDAQGKEIANVGGDPAEDDEIHRQAVRKAIASGQVQLVDFHANRATEENVELGFMAPIRMDNQYVGALYLAVDPSVFLYPLIKGWPVPSDSAETFLFRRDGSRVVYLNSPRHTDEKALLMSRPIADPRLPAAAAALGKRGLMDGVDYRGIKVLASLHAIPGTPWLMVAKIDEAEAYAAADRLALMSIILALILLTSSAATIWLWWQRRLEKTNAEADRAQAEQELMSKHYSFMSKYANDIILLAGQDNKIIEANDRALQAYGYTRAELIGMHGGQLRAENERERFDEDVQRVEQQRGRIYETIHQRKDGSQFPVEVNARLIDVGDAIFHHLVMRDITDRKQNEDALRRNNRALTMLSTGNRTLVRSTDEPRLLEAMCRVAVEVGGYRMAWVGYKMGDDERTVLPMAQVGFEEGYLERAAITWHENERGNGPAGTAIRSGQTQVVADVLTDQRFSPWREEAIKRGYRSNLALPLKNGGNVFGVLMVYADHVGAFDEMEIPLFEEMAEDLSYGVMALRNDIARRHAQHDLDRSYSLLQAALESTADGILVTTISGEIESHNQRFVDMFGIPRAIIEHRLGGKVVEFIAHLASKPSEFLERIRAISQVPEAAYRDIFDLKDGRTVERITQPQYLFGQVIGRVCSYRDISDQKHHEQQLTYLANHDALTGLPNRNLLNDRLQQAIAHAYRSDSLVAVLCFDMDRFKLINDSLGHDNGDLFLKQLAQRLPACVREGDTVARMGGDEFVVLLPDLAHEEDAASVARKLLDIIAAPYTVAGRELFSMASIGISLYPRNGNDAATLLKNADAAMYRAKERGGNCFQFITDEINDLVLRQLDIASKLRHALERNELEIYYQPQIDIQQEQVTGAEALLRWRHPEMGMVSPAEFIPVAEETGLILDISAWVAETVCAQMKSWQAAGLPEISVAINLSARQFDLSDLPITFSRLLDKTGIEARSLEIEITEGMVMKYPDRAVQMLSELKAMGFSIAIDDFGTGYSSLGYLKRFPIDKLKIDRSFVMDITEDKDDAAITRAVIAMAHELRLKVVAEGVETDAQFAFLRQYGCDVVQGYLTGRPMPAAEFETMLNSADRGGSGFSRE